LLLIIEKNRSNKQIKGKIEKSISEYQIINNTKVFFFIYIDSYKEYMSMKKEIILEKNKYGNKIT